MYDTVAIYCRGRNGQDFDLNPAKFKKVEFNGEVEDYHNVFYDSKGKRAISVKNDLKNDYALVSWSIPKMIKGNSLYDFRLDDTDKMLKEMNKRLDGIINADFLNWQLSRLDIAMNINVDHKTGLYVEALRQSVETGKRYKVKAFGNETILIYNKSRRYEMYDKVIEQVKVKDISRNEAKRFGNVLRFENQNKKSQHVQTTLRSKKPIMFNELFTAGMIADCKQVLINAYDQFFCNYGQSEMFANDLALVDLVSKYSKRNILKNYVIRKSIEDGEPINYNYLETIFRDKLSDRGLRKAIKELQTLANLHTKKVSDVIDEIRYKLVA
jgi:hypothetical protein